jgi:cytochrome c oxidase subunit 2
VSTVVLIAYVGWTIVTMDGIARPPSAAAFTIDVVAHQWWWEFRYDDPAGGRSFTTANEVHVPVGRPVQFTLRTSDVIHSFWVPALGGKTDIIPGRTNRMWLQADKPGIYQGQCSEYCGLQHAQMALRVIADTPDDFAVWRQNQLTDAASPMSAAARLGLVRFEQRCVKCHSVRGIPAGDATGPDLSHLMSRTTIAAGVLANTPANLSGWIADPQGIKPGAKMPAVPLSGPELTAIQAYLLTLK